MTKNEEFEVIRAAVRWSNNILTEMLGNYGTSMPRDMRDKLRIAVSALSDISFTPSSLSTKTPKDTP